MRRVLRSLALVVVPVLAGVGGAACGNETPVSSPADPPPPRADGVVYLPPARHLVRISMALRGVRPSVEDLEAVTASPELLPGIVDRWLGSPSIFPLLREMHDETLRVKVPPVVFPAGFPARGPLATMESQALNDDVTDAPLRLVEHVVANDRPYSEIVTADYTVANGVVSKVWGLAHQGPDAEWTETRYPDGREHAGILSDSFLFTRHSTTYSNANRGRANAISSALLCHDYLTRDVEIDSGIDLANPDAVADATKTNAACASCHQTLDPLAAFFAPHRPQYVPSFEQSYPIIFNTAPLASVYAKSEPSYFGHAGRGLRFLGAMIAQDPRFSLCTAKRFYAYLNQVPLDHVPVARAAELQKVLTSSGMNAKALLRAIVLSDDFRVSHVTADAAEGLPPGLRKVRARELGRLLGDLTGISWQTEIGVLSPDSPYDPGRVGKIDLLADGFFGYAVLFGGTDAYYVTRPSHALNATALAVLRAAASRAAAEVVERDLALADPAKRRLLRRVSATDTSEAAVREGIADLHARIYGELAAVSSEEVSATYGLFQEALAAAGGDAKRAWTTTVFAMLQDVRLVFT